MAFLCNPNNPTGRLLKRNAVLAIAEAAEQLSCYLVVDEAFIDFVPEHSVIHDVAHYSHLIVLRSLTKYYALSGLRIGYGAFSQDVAGLMHSQKEPWTVNSLAQKAGRAALNDLAYQKKTVAVIKEGKQFFEKSFTELGIEYVPSAVNYYLLRLSNAQEAIGSLRKKGILVRDCSNFPGLDGSDVRVAVRSLEENAALLKELAGSCAL
jgi:threonine-phosphate decarboxylase